ncbi:MAG: TetR/AcrR family transcriptional regulator C-terminal domain-containing protein [Bacilli bacterium]|nr:TetR/AcrR family transcriptional regulator C-terminal domain-containing protein [Bacilli bacterium]
MTDINKINYISKFYLTGITSIIMEWINNNCIDSIDYISDIILLCNNHSFI